MLRLSIDYEKGILHFWKEWKGFLQDSFWRGFKLKEKAKGMCNLGGFICPSTAYLGVKTLNALSYGFGKHSIMAQSHQTGRALPPRLQKKTTLTSGLVGKSDRNSGNSGGIPNSGPFFEPIFPIWFPIPIRKWVPAMFLIFRNRFPP